MDEITGSVSKPAMHSEAFCTPSAIEALSDFNAAVDEYRDNYFGRSLGPEEIDLALQEIVVMQTGSVSLLKAWQHALSDGDQMVSGLSQSAVRANGLMADGAVLLRSLRPSVTYALHLYRQCKRNAAANLIESDKTDASAEASEALNVIASTVEGDVSLLVGRVSVLLMEQQRAAMDVQTDLNGKVGRLATVTTWLTLIILLATLLGVAVGAFSAFQ